MDVRSEHVAYNLPALALEAEAVLVPSATRLGDNLVILPDRLRQDSRIEPVGSIDPRLRRA